METLKTRVSFLIFTLIIVLIIVESHSYPVFADPELPLPRMPICGDQDGSELPFIVQCPDFIVSPDVQVYKVPGNDPAEFRFDFIFREASFDNELGFFYVDSISGAIDGLNPGDPGYLEAAFNRAKIIFPSGSSAFTPDITFQLNAGDILVFYIIQNDSLANFLINNPNNELSKQPLAFFSLDSLNPDGVDHFVGFQNPGANLTQLGFEDLTNGGDLDYDDVVYDITPTLEPITVPTYTISGRVTDTSNNPIPDVTISDGAGHSTTTDSNGDYALSGLVAGTYTIIPLKSGYTFSPPSHTISVPPDVSGRDFMGMALVDSDGDGLPDEWEINGVDTIGNGQPDLDLASLEEVGENIAPNRLHKDVYVWVNWLELDEDNDGITNNDPDSPNDHSHRPDEEALLLVKEAFARAPAADVSNPDGQPGINLHIILGNAILETNDLVVLGNFLETIGIRVPYVSDEFANLKKQFLQENGTRMGMAGVFHYAIFAHYLPEYTSSCPTDTGRPSGIALFSLIPFGVGSDFIICHQCLLDKNRLDPLTQGGVFMHELGHTFNLGHGGVDFDGTNYKPNHLSVMNYSFNLGLFFRNDGQSIPTRSLLDYSRFESGIIPNLNENSLTENGGLQGGAAIENYGTVFYNGYNDTSGVMRPANADIDWNFNFKPDQDPVQANINRDDHDLIPFCQDRFSDLSTSNEWRGLSYTQGHIGKAARLIQDFPSETIVDEPDLVDVILAVTELVLAKSVTPNEVDPGGTVEYTVELGNSGTDDLVDVSIVDTLPDDFTYQLGSTSGATSDDPINDGQQLTWSGPFTVPVGDILTLSFKVTASTSFGTFFTIVEASGTAVSSVRISATAVVVVLRKTYLPVILKNFKGPSPLPPTILKGVVTDNGIPVVGTELLLRYNDGSTWSTYATTTTDSNGNYQFSSLPDLGPDQELYVLWLNNNTDPDQLASWSCSIISSSTTDPDVYQCSFDVDNIELLLPTSGASVSLPQTFSWSKRSITTDDYELNLIDISDFDPWWWTDPSLGYVDNYTLNGLPGGFLPGEQYGWFMGVRGVNGVGFSYNYHVIIFSTTGVSEVETIPLPARIAQEHIEMIALPQSR